MSLGVYHRLNSFRPPRVSFDFGDQIACISAWTLIFSLYTTCNRNRNRNADRLVVGEVTNMMGKEMKCWSYIPLLQAYINERYKQYYQNNLQNCMGIRFGTCALQRFSEFSERGGLEEHGTLPMLLILLPHRTAPHSRRQPPPLQPLYVNRLLPGLGTPKSLWRFTSDDDEPDVGTALLLADKQRRINHASWDDAVRRWSGVEQRLGR
jgi:hypothetical protein